VSIKAKLKDELGKQQVEEIRAALSGLGLDDDVEIN